MKYLTSIAAIVAATSTLPVLPANAEDIAFDITFVTHIDAGVAEQDVFIDNGYVVLEHERELDVDQVWRPGPGGSALNAPVFASAEPQRHNPADPAAIGPFPKGEPLGITLDEWLAASGEGHYHCEAGQGELTIEFENLVADGVYTLWHFFMANDATDPFIGTFDLPAGAFDGSQSVFFADADGSATYSQTFENCLQLSGEQLTAGLAVNWHSDGETFGVEPGHFGLHAHIQLFAALPTRAGL